MAETKETPFSFTREAFWHFNDAEWTHVMELAGMLGERAAISLFRDSTTAQQQAAVRSFMLQKVASIPLPPEPRHSERPLKVPISTYSGNERENLPRWFMEIDMALDARHIDDDHQKVVFLIAHLGGRARAWAFSNAMLNDREFPSYDELKEDLIASFQPPLHTTSLRKTL